MRLDKYLKISRLIKRRTVANEACDNGRVTLNGRVARASAEVKPGDVIASPASHGEGRFVASDAWIRRLFENGQVATQYADFDGNVSMDEEWNVNGSYCAIEGITSPDGRVFGKMGHSERKGSYICKNVQGEKDQKIFESGVKYFT